MNILRIKIDGLKVKLMPLDCSVMSRTVSFLENEVVSINRHSRVLFSE